MANPIRVTVRRNIDFEFVILRHQLAADINLMDDHVCKIAFDDAEIGKLADFLSDPELFAKSPDKFRRASERLAERQLALTAAEEEWLMLEEKAQA